MKLRLLYSLLLMLPLTVAAQLKVNSDGTVLVGLYDFGTNHVGFGSSISQSNGYNIGVAGRSNITNGNTVSVCCGVYGHANNPYVGLNYGVVGELNSSCSLGAGILGSNTYILGYSVGGKYAGYFYGNTYVNGTLTATHVVESSDRRLKENITSLRDMKESTLNKLLDINVVEYNFKPEILSAKLPDSVSIEEAQKCTGIYLDKKHIGVIAQELQTLYPDMVVEGQDGYLAVNYIELIPVLIRSVQELKQELDEVKGNNSEVAKSRSETTVIAADKATTGNVLYQNTPNPFKEQTTIRFSLADDVTSAAICIFDMSGKMLKKLPVSSGDGSVSVNGWELGEGMFLYSLLVNGCEIDTKRMIISK